MGIETERRLGSMEAVLITLGKLEQSTTDIKETTVAIDKKVTVQNGRVGKLEQNYSFIRGAVAILILIVIPIIINFVSSWLSFTFGKH